MRLFRDYVFHNWSLKLLALAISFFLWTTYTSEPMAEVGFQVPVEFISVPRNLEISGEVPAQVHLRVRGRPGLLRHLTPGDLAIRVDLSSAHPGDNRFSLSPSEVDSPYGATIVRITPAEIRVPLALRRVAP